MDIWSKEKEEKYVGETLRTDRNRKIDKDIKRPRKEKVKSDRNR